MKKKPDRKYITTRTEYKLAKTYDREKFDEYCTSFYNKGFKDGKDSVVGVEAEDIIKAIKNIKGIGDKRLSQIEAAVSELFGKEG